jgi:diadenosine tetraphosphatase ApaH/serine/threonine PP2A family protein phosphatase
VREETTALMTSTTEAPVKHEYERIPYLVAYQNTSGVRDVYGGVAELVVLESYLLKPKTKTSDTALVFMHPIGGGAYLPMINALARAGHHVIYCNSRFRGTDSALLMEKFLDRYREAQIARNRRITKWVKEKLAQLKAEGRPDDEFGFVVHGTMADPRWLDPTVDPNDRAPGTCYLGDPQVVNNSPVGLARFCTLRSWLSQWSYDDANGDAVKCGPDIAVPTLVIGNLADDACTPSHTRRLFEAIGHPDKEMHEIPGANHYYSGPAQRGTLRQAVGVVTDWLHRHGFSQ